MDPERSYRAGGAADDPAARVLAQGPKGGR
jgi:hypothetical protein